MRNIIDMDNLQIEVSGTCMNKCANCSRFLKHYPSWFMPFNQFKVAVDSVINYPKMTGVTGGEPLLNPNFEKMCSYLHSKIPPEKCGLWSCFPKGFEHYREVIVETFQHVFLNDHTINTVMHHPFLVASQEVISDEASMWHMISHCQFQESWSASINTFGAYFCEEAAALALLYNDPDTAWKIEPNWWTRQVWDFTDQIRKWCSRCGGCLPLKMRSSTEILDDISLKNWELLGKPTGFKVHNLRMEQDNRQLASYKDFNYRNSIAKRYGGFLTINSENYWTFHLYKNFEVKK